MTVTKKQRVPVLRFPEFTGEWQEKKLGEVTKINQGLQIPISDRFTKKVLNSYFYITNEFLKEGSTKKYYIQNPPQSVICNENDILMTRTGNTGQVLTGVSGAFHNNFFKVKYSKNCNKSYLYYFLKLDKTQRIILKYAGASTIPDLNHSDFYRINIHLPSLFEQQKIADFLSSLDERIRLLKEKKKNLEAYKKGVMQQIFLQSLRFKDKNGNDYPNWEEKKLGDIGETYNGLTGKTAEAFGKGKPYIQYKQIFDDSLINIDKCAFVDIKENESQSNVQYGDVFFTVSSETPNEVGMSSVLLQHVNNMYLNSFSFGFRPNDLDILSPHFLRYLFRSKDVRAKIIKLAQGSTRYNMSKNEFLKIKVSVPSFPEQLQIADFLSAIDDHITLYCEQIKESENYKKGLLQQMFVY